VSLCATEFDLSAGLRWVLRLDVYIIQISKHSGMHKHPGPYNVKLHSDIATCQPDSGVQQEHAPKKGSIAANRRHVIDKGNTATNGKCGHYPPDMSHLGRDCINIGFPILLQLRFVSFLLLKHSK
jgi:hypothetical protein